MFSTFEYGLFPLCGDIWKEPERPFGILKDSWENTEKEKFDVCKWVEELQERLEVIKNCVREKEEKSKKKMKDEYDKKAEVRELKEGSLVLLLSNGPTKAKAMTSNGVLITGGRCSGTFLGGDFLIIWHLGHVVHHSFTSLEIPGQVILHPHLNQSYVSTIHLSSNNHSPACLPTLSIF